MCCLTIGNLIGVFIGQFRQRKSAAVGNVHTALDCGGKTLKQPRHISWRFQAAFRIGQRLFADAVHRQPLAQTGQHIGQTAARSVVHQHITQRHHRQAGALRQRGQRIKPRLILPVIAGGRPQINHARKTPGDLQQISGISGSLRALRQGDQDQPGGMIHHIRLPQMAFAFRRAPLAKA